MTGLQEHSDSLFKDSPQSLGNCVAFLSLADLSTTNNRLQSLTYLFSSWTAPLWSLRGHSWLLSYFSELTKAIVYWTDASMSQDVSLFHTALKGAICSWRNATAICQDAKEIGKKIKINHISLNGLWWAPSNSLKMKLIKRKSWKNFKHTPQWH